MGKSKYGDGDNSRKRESRDKQYDSDLTSRPLAGLKGMKVGPECLECKGVIDTREAYSIPLGRGSRKTQRHGYLHLDCEIEAMKKFAESQGRPAQVVHTVGQRVFVSDQSGCRLEVPVFSADEICLMTGKKEGS